MEPGEDGGSVVEEGDQGSEPAGRAGGSGTEAAKRKVRIEAAISDCAKTWGGKASVLRDRIKQRMLDEFQKEHFVDLTPLECGKVHHWLETGTLLL